MVRERPLRDFLSQIARHDPFTYTRWGTGEWHAVFGERNGFIPKDGYWYFHSLCREVTDVLLRRPQYSLGLPGDTLTEFGGRVEDYINGCGLWDLDWTHDDALKPVIAEDVQQLLTAVSHTNLVMVGPPHLRKTWSVLRYKAFIDVPPRNAYLCKDEIVCNTLAALENLKGHCLVSVSAGIAASLVIDKLHNRVGDRHTLIDFGSVWEPFVKVK